MIHQRDFNTDKWDATYISILNEVKFHGFCLSTSPPEREFLNWLKYDKGLSTPGTILIEIVEIEELGAVWRIIISSGLQSNDFNHLE